MHGLGFLEALDLCLLTTMYIAANCTYQLRALALLKSSRIWAGKISPAAVPDGRSAVVRCASANPVSTFVSWWNNEYAGELAMPF